MAKPSITANRWGPDISQIADKTHHAPYNKNERIGKIADWTTPAEPNQQAPKKKTASEISIVSNYQQTNQDDSSFSILEKETLSAKKSALKTSRPQGLRGAFKDGTFIAAPNAIQTKQYDSRRKLTEKQQRLKDPFIKIGADWKLLDEFDFSRLSNLHYEADDPVDMYVIRNRDDDNSKMITAYDRMTTKQEKTLLHTEKVQVNNSASNDPILKDIVKDLKGKVFVTTDTILSALMCSSRSIYSWDLLITKNENVIFLDKRNGSALDLLWVNENASEPPVDTVDKEFNINTPQPLAHEATHINKLYHEFVLQQNEQISFKDQTPYAEDSAPEIVASGAFRYRKWDLGETTLLVRTRVDAAVQGVKNEAETFIDAKESTHPLSETILAKIQALNEFDYRAPGSGGAPNWREKLDGQRGAVIATEIKNNSCKLSRWAVEAILSGSEQLRVGFVSRASPRDRKKHVVLGTAIFKPFDFCDQLNFDIYNAWGIAKAFIDMFFERLGDGKYALVKDGNKPILNLYQASSIAVDSVEDVSLDE